MRLPQRLARFNRHVTNPIQRLWAGWLPAFGILLHTGRRSGRAYRTPLNVFPTVDGGRPGFAVLLTYGPDRDWLKNITAGGARLRHYGRTVELADPRVVSRAEAATLVVRRWRWVFARLPFAQAVLLRAG